MKEILYILTTILFFSCTEKTKINQSENTQIKEEIFYNDTINSSQPIKISQQEKEFNDFLESIKKFKLQPIDTILISYETKQLEEYEIGKNSIKIFKKDSLNIDWIKINSNRIIIEKLKSINPRIDNEYEEMFCNNVQKVKLYNFNNDEIIFIEFTSHPCTGLGCSVTDYLIYDVKNNQVNLFGNFRTADLDLYNFPIDSNLNYISTEYQGDFHGATPIHFISKVYSLDKNGKFHLKKDLKGKDYFYKISTFPNDKTKAFEYERNWF
ncbi:hypothetical protein [Paenimyroides aestuarii]|uniref:Lipoprotein n=1 Tax=Paenimyroides aestuarii TaxID=2968490 RepID=A0ABY5NQA0_9FLAO|nr:hypothetical protein [Paenimyroides aestuarii]UUV20752.1 hypothetical protein NPX36_10540 [Paenimyroides aestuarii]